MKKEQLEKMARENGNFIYNGRRYIQIGQAYNDSEWVWPYREVFKASAIREDEALTANDETDYIALYDVTWEVINPDAENAEDCCDWERPENVEANCEYDPETGRIC